MPRAPEEKAVPADSTVDSLIRDAAAISEPRADRFAKPFLLGEGEVIAGRFVVERLAGRGGMGAVYRARDRTTGGPVALKVMHGHGRDDERFAQESRVLAELSHPAIVRYVGHGSMPQGHPFLAMEWLEGVDLADHLARAGLGVSDSLTVARRVAEGLAAAHARGVIHRDVKPSNVFLVDGDPARTKLLDFGIVRMQLAGVAPTAPPMTQTGQIIGTVGYMSPEQAIADRALDVRADVFALGCVLFECLTGKPAFSGAHVVAVLAKVLRDDPPRLRSLRPDLPAALDDLVARLLSKNKEGRPADGAAVLHELEAMGPASAGSTVPSRSSGGLSAQEQRMVSVLLADRIEQADLAREIVRRHGGDLVRLANGALFGAMTGRASTSDQAVAAAACALELARAFPSARMALSVGRTPTLSEGPPGLLIDQAAALLAHSPAPGIRVDEITATLLGERFELRAEASTLILSGPRTEAEVPRTLLGRPTPCVGRDRELALLDMTLRECVDESVARAVLVTGPPGQGKSRLRHEFIGRARQLGGVQILLARADPVGAGSSFMMARQLVRQAVGLHEGDPVGEQQAQLRAHLEALCKGPGAARIADFLGELLGLPPPAEPSPELRAAKGEPQAIASWLERSFGDWIAAESAVKPQLLVLEDLHWGDLPSVAYVSEVLRKRTTRSVMVLALARPEAQDLFPDLWASPGTHSVALAQLSPRAAARLVRNALGDTFPDEAVDRVIQRADGNAFYLEELVRRVSEGGQDTLPETVLALVQSRIERLELEARKVVRAASVFGEVFWQGAVASLMGEMDGGELDGWLSTLSRGELITAGADSRFPGEREFVFRHGLLREAAYAMLTPADRMTGHKLAGEWLERAGERDALIMADHFERGGEPQRSMPWLLRAAVSSLMGGNLDAAVDLGARGVAGGAEGMERARLRLVQAGALSQRGNWHLVLEVAKEGMAILPVGSTRWFGAAANVLCAAVLLNEQATASAALQTLKDVEVPPEPTVAYATAVHVSCTALGILTHFDAAREILRRSDVLVDGVPADPLLAMRLRYTRAHVELAGADLAGAIGSIAAVREYLSGTRDVMCQAASSMLAAQACAEAGHLERARAAANELRGLRHMVFFTTHAECAVAICLLLTGAPLEAVPTLRRAVSPHDLWLALSARAFLGIALAEAGQAKDAEQEADIVLREALTFPSVCKIALRVRATLALQRGHAAEALECVKQALDLAPHGWWSLYNESALHLLRAEALHALGQVEPARGAIREALGRLLRIADTLSFDPELRSSYLSKIVVHVRTRELARQWLGDDALPASPS